MNTLKKISFGVFAFLFGLTIVFTQSAFKGDIAKNIKRLPVTLYYHGPDFSQPEVLDESNWNNDAPEDECTDAQQRACSITISDEFVETTGSYRELKDEAILRASASGSTYYVTGSEDGSMAIVNSEN
jgi:hypothetical protein